jgi:hypothetical protein
MPEGYTVTPQPVAGQQGPAWIRWLDRYAQEHVAAVAQVAVRDFPPLVREQITQEADGETMTPSTMQSIGNSNGLFHRPPRCWCPRGRPPRPGAPWARRATGTIPRPASPPAAGGRRAAPQGLGTAEGGADSNALRAA